MSCALALLACAERAGAPAAPCGMAHVTWRGGLAERRALDLLFVIGGGGADAEQHAARVREIERLVRIVASGDWDEDGARDFVAPDLHLGVISTSLGSGGHAVDGCAPYEAGDDGTWRELDCARELPSFIAYDPEAPAVDASSFVACRSARPSCPIEQPLEAALKALSPAAPTETTGSEYVAPRFFGGTTGHGDGAHAGFVRREALLAVVVVSGADDCSARDVALYDPASRGEETHELGCVTHDEALHPVARFVDGLRAVKRGWGVSFSVIGGAPEDLVPAGEPLHFAPLVSEDPAVRDPRMQPRPDEADPSRLAAACQSATLGGGAPAVRLIEAARLLASAGDDVAVASVCGADYRAALQPTMNHLRSRIGWGTCLPRPALVDERCALEVVLPEGVGCEAISGSTLAGIDAERARCALPRLEPTLEQRAARALPRGPGWLVDDYTVDAELECAYEDRPWGQLMVVPRPPRGASALLRCSIPVPPSAVDGHLCGPEDDLFCAHFASAAPLACDPFALACGVPCTHDDDCRAAELPGYGCDLRPLGELDPLRFPGDTSPRGFCVSATCD